MATSTIKLYEVFFNPSNNCRIDDFETYLEDRTRYTFLDHQYTKHGLDITVKLDLPQSNVTNNNWNYVSIINSDDTKTYYYFIMNTRWLARNSVELTLSIDSINTYWNDVTPLFTANTLVTRRHKDRFKQVTVPETFSTLKLIRNVDSFDEGLQPVLYRKSKPTHLSYKTTLDKDWYLIYKTEKPLNVNDQNNPLRCYLCSNERLKVANATSSATLLASQFTTSEYIYITKYDNPNLSGTVGSTQMNWTVDIGGKKAVAYILNKTVISGQDIWMLQILLTDTSGNYEINSTSAVSTYSGTATFTNIQKYRKSFYRTYNYNTMITLDSFVKEANTTGTYVKALSEIDKTDSSIMKIIKLPYPPCEITISNGLYSFDSSKFTYDTTNEIMKAVALDIEFSSQLLSMSLQPQLVKTITPYMVTPRQAKDIDFESKMFNSNLYNMKLMYDQFSKEIMLERWNKNATENNLSVDIKFKPSNNILSKFLFEITSTNYNEVDDYSEYMIVDRNNEVSLYNNDYLNYIRQSMRYEKTSYVQKTAASALGAGVSLAGGLIGLAAGGVSAAAGISLVTNAISSATSLVSNAIQSERSIAQKRDQLASQSGSITASDTNLMSYYTGNRLNKIEYNPSDTVMNHIYNLFYLTGYKDSTYMIPNFNTRCNFDFVQCVPDFMVDEWKYPKPFLDDITSRLQSGITVYHRQRNSYDFEQQYENLENWILG